jgi:hypothetical protein
VRALARLQQIHVEISTEVLQSKLDGV